MRDVAHRVVDRRDAGSAQHVALADIALWVDAEAQEDRHPARPLLEELARNVAPCQHRANEVRRIGNTALATSARSGAARPTAGARASPAGAGAGSADIGRALSRRSALARRLGDRDW